MDEKLYILDGHSHLYAAFYAIRNLTTPSGEPSNAIYGVVSIILKLLRDHKPDHIVAVFDPHGETYRNTIYSGYKANRSAMPEDLASQIDKTHEVLRAMGITVIVVDGYEADDVIGYIARKGDERGMKSVICSKDKDLQQLLNANITLFDTSKEKVTDVDSLLADKGLRPDQVIDYLALMGDTADNIPGIPGVGPKTAEKLIREYGSIEGMIANPEKLPPKVKKFIAEPENIEKLKLSQTLVTLIDELPVEFTPEKWTSTIPDKAKLAQLFTELGFTRFIQQMGLGDLETQIPADDKTRIKKIDPIFKQITSLDELKELITKWSTSEPIAIDTETTGLDPLTCELIGMSFAADETTGWYLPLRSCDGQHLSPVDALEIVKPFLEDESIPKIGQNIKYDILVFKNQGIELAGVYFDTMIASYVISPERNSHGMDFLAQEFLAYKTTKIKELIGTGAHQLTLDQIETNQVSDYAAEDAWVTYRLYQALKQRLEETKLIDRFTNIEMPLLNVLVDMEFNGVAIDSEKLAKLSRELRTKTHQLSDEIFELAGRIFNIDSPKQLGEVLFDDLQLPVSKLTKTGRSTNVQVLETLAHLHPMPKLILEYRQLQKLKNTYVDKLPEMVNLDTGKIHASFNQSVTATGRLSSSDPNLQNIPIRSELGKQIRSAFVPFNRKENCILTCDYSQVELRLLAHLSGDKHLIEAFKSDQDIHAFVASQVFGVDINLVAEDQRRVAKTVNFGIIYGQTAHGLSQTLGIGRAEAQTFIDSYFDRYPRISDFIQSSIESTRKTGYATTIMGHRRAIPEINTKNKNQRAFAERTAVNTIVQGSAADMIKLAMINIENKIKAGEISAKMLIQVHDELVFETPIATADETQTKVVELMTTALPLKVPVKVDAAHGENWLESK